MPIGIPSGLGGTWLNAGTSWLDQPSANDLYQRQQLGVNPNWNGVGAADPAGGSPSSVPGSMGFNISPSPRSGTNAFGYIPGQLGLPNPAGDLGAQIPGLPQLNAQASNTIGSYLGGQIPVDVQKSIQDAAARFGVSSGMPGSGLATNRTLRDFGLTSLDLSNKGLAAYNPFVSTVSGTQTVNPALQAQIAEQNAVNAAAPDPTLAASYAKRLYDQYLNNLARSGRSTGGFGGGPAGGTGAFATPGSGDFLPHVTENQSFTPGAFDFSGQFAPDTSASTSFGSLAPDATSYTDLGLPVFDNTFGVPDVTGGGYGQDYPNYVMDWFGNGDSGAPVTDWFGG